MNRASFRVWVALATSALGLTLASTSRADGDEEFSDLLSEVDVGLGLAFNGVGLSGRREGGVGNNVPVEQATLSLTGVAIGSSIRHAYLYWAVYGSVGDATIALDGNDLTGTLIGTSAHTCWDPGNPDMLQDDPNRVYRADVKSLITGAGDYEISGFPSVLAESDTQGAQLVVVYDDPASNTPRRVMVRDGAMTGSFENGSVEDDFTLIEDEGPRLESFWHLATGDGQAGIPEGVLRFKGTSIGPIGGGAVFVNGEGQYWDSISFDVSGRLDSNDSSVGWSSNNSEGDCILYAVSALEYTLEALPEPSGGNAGAGGQSGSGEGGAPRGGSAPIGVDGGADGEAGEPPVSTGGGPGSKPGGSGGDADSNGQGGAAGAFIDDADARDDGGCGCRVVTRANSASATLLGALGLWALWRRRRGAA